MDNALLHASPLLNLSGRTLGALQTAGPLSMLPVFGPDAGDAFVPPLSGLKLARVAGYGNVEMECRPTARSGDGGVAIVPLHIGYIQDGAQNHALCRSALLAAGQKLMFRDACCVQQSQGGYLEGRDQWFFILPLSLRHPALSLRGKEHYGKLWDAITSLNSDFGLEARGHLEQIICRQRAVLTQYVSRLELEPGQLGAFFFLDGQLVGLELAPTAEYFAELWMPLVCFCYGTAALRLEQRRPQRPPPAPLAASSSLEAIAQALAERRKQADQRAREAIAAAPSKGLSSTDEERMVDLRLSTVQNDSFAGQVVHRGEHLVYASLAATPSRLASLTEATA